MLEGWVKEIGVTETTDDVHDLSDIVRAAQQGDTGAFEQLVTRFQTMATAIGYSMLGDWASAQDAAQEAFIEAYLCLTALRVPAAFPGWFRRIVAKQCDRIYRRSRPEVLLEESQVADGNADPASIFDERVTRQAVRCAVDSLPPTQRQVAVLYYLLDFSQQEIMDTWALSSGAVKKRLFDARKTLRERMATWSEVIKMQTNKDPLSDDLTKNRVMFFVALNTHDLTRIQRLLDQSPELMVAPFEWDAGALGHYWPLGHTAMHWAAATDDRPLIDALLSRGVAIDTLSSHDRRTPLHVAALMGRPDVVTQLLTGGAYVNARDAYGHTPLHLAAWANQAACAALLLRQGATPEARDDGGRTPIDWSAIRNAQEVLDLFGATTRQVKMLIKPDCSTPVLETGLKIIDVCVPLLRGGVNALFSPRSGVGKMVTVNGLIHVMATQYGGHTIWLGLDHGLFVHEGLALAERNAGLAYVVDVVTAQQDDPASFLRATDEAIAAARDLSARGQAAMLLVASPVALADGVMQRLRTVAHDAPTGAVTVVLYGDQTVGAEHEIFAALDAAVSFDSWRVQQGLHPSIDVLNSRSALLDRGGVGERHAHVARQIRRLLRRQQDLSANPAGNLRGLDGLPVTDDTVLLKRARLIHEFLTQPMPDVELFFHRPAVYVPLLQTLEDCEAILAGRLDYVNEGGLLYRGAIDPTIMGATH